MNGIMNYIVICEQIDRDCSSWAQKDFLCYFGDMDADGMG